MGVENSFPEGTKIKFGLRGSIKQRQGENPKDWDRSFQHRVREKGKNIQEAKLCMGKIHGDLETGRPDIQVERGLRSEVERH